MQPYFETLEHGKLLVPEEFFLELKLKAKMYDDLMMAQQNAESIEASGNKGE
ncbi:hypothetical protein [uncultured Paenibacillus sp.]|uniref:hypothetical protein n=1 Tax=uncultured Paenibacillus sp. TaxID=227322 RepID=UPI0015AE34BC|nr:hypothetical protein [uncultured Paenibacillus sp.]